jgi:RNA polymerase sigma factor (sigma-70 family)
MNTYVVARSLDFFDTEFLYVINKPFSVSLAFQVQNITALPAIKKEEELVSQLKAKQKEALSYLYDHYSGALYGVVFRIVKKQEQAEEVLQDIFLKIWDRIGTYDASKGKLFTWMVNIARNQAIDKTRSKELRNENKTDDIAILVDRIDNKEYGELPVESIGVKEVVGKLPAEQKFVIEYLYLKGYTQSELAEEFNIPLGTVKTRLRMAMNELRSILKIN